MYSTNADKQFSKDLFEQWKRSQQESVSERGSHNDPAVEEEYIKTMLRQNLNAFVCHMPLDRYTSCLKQNGLLDKKGEEFEVNTKNKINEIKCRSTHQEYVTCMSSQSNQEVVLHSAAIHPSCQSRRQDLLECVDLHRETETRTSVPQCKLQYNRMIRCGLNHIWNEYWRSLTRFGEAEEYHLYEMSRDDRKKQQFLEFVTDKERYDRIGEELAKERGDGLGSISLTDDDVPPPMYGTAGASHGAADGSSSGTLPRWKIFTTTTSRT